MWYEFKILGRNAARNMAIEELIDAHSFSSNNREALMRDDICGCFYCIKIFSPHEINEWIEDSAGTAVCPYCGIDSILGKSSGYPIKQEFLLEMKAYWFG